MTCTTIERHCGTLDECRTGAGTGRVGLVRRTISRIGEGLFHYRYVRAGLIERALERQNEDREARS